jgi:hypothetical protein
VVHEAARGAVQEEEVEVAALETVVAALLAVAVVDHEEDRLIAATVEEAVGEEGVAEVEEEEIEEEGTNSTQAESTNQRINHIPSAKTRASPRTNPCSTRMP